MTSDGKYLRCALVATCALVWHAQASAQTKAVDSARGPSLAPATQTVPLSASSGPRDLQKEENNKKIVLGFYKDTDPDRRVALMSDNYIQHNPRIKTGKEGVRAFFIESLKTYPLAREQVHRVAAEGDYVWVHLNIILTPDDPGLAVVDIFRVENGKLAEHWDVFQPIPKEVENNNSMF